MFIPLTIPNICRIFVSVKSNTFHGVSLEAKDANRSCPLQQKTAAEFRWVTDQIRLPRPLLQLVGGDQRWLVHVPSVAKSRTWRRGDTTYNSFSGEFVDVSPLMRSLGDSDPAV